MPTFDFVCGDCSNVFEFSRPFGSKEHPVCPKCGSKKTEKKIVVPPIHFKGKGFYVTDSHLKSESRKDKKEEKETTDNKKKEKPPETKVAAKPADGKKLG